MRAVLRGGFDPATDPHRHKVALLHGEMHLLPSALDGVVGVEVLGDSAGGLDCRCAACEGGLPSHGWGDAHPKAVMDAAALTEIRTLAVAVMGARAHGGGGA